MSCKRLFHAFGGLSGNELLLHEGQQQDPQIAPANAMH